MTATCDTDWEGCAETRRSTTCVCIDWGGFLITCFSRLSNGSRLVVTRGRVLWHLQCRERAHLCDGRGPLLWFRSGWLDLVGFLRCALSLSQRQGVGHQRHIEARYLWIQDHVQHGTLKVGKIPGSLNKADVGTKHVAYVTTYCVTFAHWDCENGKLPMRAPEET